MVRFMRRRKTERPRSQRLAIGLAALSAVAALGRSAQAQGGMREALMERGQALEAMIGGSGDASIQEFVEEQLSPEFRAAFTDEEHLAQLKKIRRECASAGGIQVEPLGGDGLVFDFFSEASSRRVELRLDAEPPHLIAGISMTEGPPEERGADVEPVTWAGLEARLAEEAEQGFAGAILVVRDGEVVLHRAYGDADRANGIPNTTDTLFAIGSVPIDFTKAAILKLEELGKLSTADPIEKFLKDVPDDKRAITIDHLMTGRSGLPNFHHVAGVDENYDLSWIDRDTAIERMLGKELLFEPGEGRAHSHSAWGLLAALVEIVSGDSYQAFLDEHFFGPAGMKKTGNYHVARRYEDKDVALGYGRSPWGEINSPKYWGETSWLVMGSGGMVSNPSDLQRWIRAMRAGKLLSTSAQEKYWSPGAALAGDNDRGFLCTYTEGFGGERDSFAILCSNTHGGEAGDTAENLAQALVELVNRPRFRLGIRYAPGPPAVLESVAPESPAAEAGLKEGDQIVGLNGELLERVDRRLARLLRTGEPIVFELVRAGERISLTVEPAPVPVD